MLFTFFYADTSAVSTFLNESQTKLTLFFLDLFLREEQLNGVDIWINPYYKIIITKACNGIIPMFFLFASIMAYPSKISHKISWILMGYVLFFVVNVARILLVVYVTQTGEGQKDFYWSHDFIGNGLLMITGLGLFIMFAKTSPKTVKNT